MHEVLSKAIEEALKNTVGRLFKWVLAGVIGGSYWICLVSCLIALLLYISGQRKAGKYISISFILYVLIQAIKGAFNL